MEIKFSELGVAELLTLSTKEYIDLIKKNNGLTSESIWVSDDFGFFVDSIRRVGVLLPIIVDKNWKIIDGVKRTRALMHIHRELRDNCERSGDPNVCREFEEFESRQVQVLQLRELDAGKVDKRVLLAKIVANLVREPFSKIFIESEETHRRYLKVNMLIQWLYNLALEIATSVEKSQLEEGVVPNRLVVELSKLTGLPKSTVDYYLRAAVGALKTGKAVKTSNAELKSEIKTEVEEDRASEVKASVKEVEKHVTSTGLVTIEVPSGRGVLTKFAQFAELPDDVIEILKRNNLVDVVLKKFKKDEIKVINDLWIQVGKDPEQFVKALLEYMREKDQKKGKTTTKTVSETKITTYTTPSVPTYTLTLKDSISKSIHNLVTKNIASETLCREIVNVMAGIFYIPLMLFTDDEDRLRDIYSKFYDIVRKVDEVLQTIYTATNPDKVINMIFTLGDLLNDFATTLKVDVVKKYQELLAKKTFGV